MNSDQSSSDSVTAALIEILRDDLNIDVSRVTQEARLDAVPCNIAGAPAAASSGVKAEDGRR
jgi:hypothetical protein